MCDALHSERREEGKRTVISGTWAMRKSIPLLSSPGGSDQRDNRRPRLFTKRTCCVNPEGVCSSLYNIHCTHTLTHTQRYILLHLCKHPRLGKSKIYNSFAQRSHEKLARAYSRFESIRTDGQWQFILHREISKNAMTSNVVTPSFHTISQKYFVKLTSLFSIHMGLWDTNWLVISQHACGCVCQCKKRSL